MVERETRPLVRFTGLVVASIGAFALLERLSVGLGRLPPAAYERSFVAPEVLERAGRLLLDRVPIGMLALLGAVVVLALIADGRLARWAGLRRISSIASGWNAVEDGAALRWFVGGVTGIATWVLAAYPYNAYFDRLHLGDRLLLVLLWAALLWRPLFVIPFAIVASAIAHQFQIPLESYSWTEMELLVRIPILFGAYWVVRSLMREHRPDAFVFLLSCLIAVDWWSSGWGKIRVGWIMHPHIDYLLLGAHANGWLGFLDAGVVERVADVVAALRVPLMLFTLAVECGALILLWRRWSLPAFLMLTITFHLGAFALTGIFFWKWIGVDLAFLVFLLRGRRITRLWIFSPAQFALSVLLIAASGIWVAGRNLTWFDTPLTYVIRLVGVDARGGTHALPAGFFRPYSETFVLETFSYLSPHPQLTGPMGVTQRREVANALLAARDSADVAALESTLGTSRYDPERSARFDRFVARTIQTWNRGAPGGALAHVSAPRHLWTFPLEAEWRGSPAIVSVDVIEITNFYDGAALREIRRRRLRTIDVGRTAESPRSEVSAASGHRPSR
ncbi:MAG TPA: hypothetical protein VK922_01490 [Gemmatimonadaceae bacterium]|nr:hypothetical protein [Gemmatimonadaceae bacterium]